MDLSYNEILLKLLNNTKDKQLFTDKLLVNIYLTLLSLNNNHYNEDIYISELDTVENFLRKVNNLKVKIQLKRKETEILLLYNEIKEIYNNKKITIDNYNINKLDILKLLDTKEPTTLTILIDNLTKEKFKRVNHKEYYEKLRKEIINNSLCSKYSINNNILLFEKNNITLPLEDFYTIFSYLLNIDNYPKKYINDKINASYLKIVTNLIKLVTKHKLPTIDTIIPIILTYLLAWNIDYQTVNTNKFNILNIKITDLYSFAKKENTDKTAKWKNISIPNEYLYNKIKEISIKGMYYFENDTFIIENNTNDFKISINITDMKVFLEENIRTINQSIQID